MVLRSPYRHLWGPFLCQPQFPSQVSKSRSPCPDLQDSPVRPTCLSNLAIRLSPSPLTRQHPGLFTHSLLFLAVLCLCRCTQAVSSYAEPGLLSSCGTWASRCRVFSWGAQALGPVGFSSCCTWAPGAGSAVVAPRGMRGLPEPGMEPVSLALQGRFLHWTTRETPHLGPWHWLFPLPKHLLFGPLPA